MTICCVVGFIISLLFTTSLGSSLVGVFDTFINQFGVVLNVIIELILITWIYGIDKILPGINKNATFLKIGPKWKIWMKYIIPIIIFIIWIKGISESLITNDTFTNTVQLLLLVALFIVPLILTKIPAKVEDY